MDNNQSATSKKYDTPQMIDVDVVVVGAGLSGLTAAFNIQLKDPGIRVVVVEANDRVGGRTLGQTLKAASGQDSWDLGGQWVGSCQQDVIELIRELGLTLYTQHTDGTKLMQLGDSGIVSRYVSEIPSLPVLSLLDLHFFMRKIDKMRRLIDVSNPNLCRYAAEWDSVTLEHFKQATMWTAAAKHSLDAAVRCMFGTEPIHVSLLYFLTYIAAADGLDRMLSSRSRFGGQEFKIEGGAWQICTRLSELIGSTKIFLNSPVVSIHQDPGIDTVIIHTLVGRKFRCKRVIVATPPLPAVSMEYIPPLPALKRHILQRMPAGSITKVIATYSKAFWKAAGLSGEAVTSGGKSMIAGCDRGPLCIVFDATTPNGNPAIVAFIGGDQNAEYSALRAEDRKSAVLHSLSELLGADALTPLEYCEKNWSDEAYCGGGPVSVCTPGAMTHAATALRQPFDRIHFAGSESATFWCGFLNGAVQSGRRAAMEVLYNLRPQALTASDLDGTAYDARHRRNKNVTRRGGTHRSNRLRWSFVVGAVAVIGYFLARRR